jgi:HK97 gp10 family phage protein
MSMRLKVDIVGVEEALARVSKFDVETRIAVRKQVRRSANRLRKNMQGRVPVKSGNLKKSIRAKYDSDQLGANVGPTRPGGSHAHLVEFGHRLVTKDGRSIGHVPAHPFITPAAEEERPKYISEMKQAIRGAVKN